MEIFVVTAPGLEQLLADEARMAGFEVADVIPGGVTLTGDWNTAAHANLHLRGATRVLVRVASFRAMHLAQLDKRARKLPWSDWLKPDVPVRVEATCRKSRIYHDRAAAQRIERAVVDIVGTKVSKTAPIAIKLRIEDDLCTVSIDTSGPSLHKRGLKERVNKAPMRETLAALFLRACGYDGTGPVYDPMCGSGTFILEAADIALGLTPGRARSFAFEQLAPSFDPPELSHPRQTDLKFFGSDRDAGAVAMAKANTKNAGTDHITSFETKPISDIEPPCTQPGLIIVNPPYGGRIGNKKPLFGLYAAFGARVQETFSGWRVGMVTSDGGLAKATGLNWDAPGPIVDHGGTKIRLWQAQID